MKAIAITKKGIEDITCLEVQEILKQKAEIKDKVVIFEIKKYDDLCKFSYLTQSTSRILLLISELKIDKDLDKTINNIKQKIDTNKKEIAPWICENKTFAARCLREGEHDYTSQEIEKQIGAHINDTFNSRAELKNPDVTFYIYINQNECYLGIDFSGFDQSKREYKIFTHPNALNGSVAYSLLKIAGYTGKEFIFDPFMKSGEIIIEAALYGTKTSPHYFNKEKFAFKKFEQTKDFNFEQIDKKRTEKLKGKIMAIDKTMGNVNAAKKNAKIAGIDKAITFSRMELELIDLKAQDCEVDSIITYPPEVTKINNETEIIKQYKEFFNQAQIILNKKGNIILISRNVEPIKKEIELDKRFKIKEEKKINQGEVTLNCLNIIKT